MPALNLDNLLAEKSLLMVGGKGGVGKTTTASALALRAAGQGRSVLLVSTDPAHSLADAFARPIGNRPTRLAPNLAPSAPRFCGKSREQARSTRPFWRLAFSTPSDACHGR